jgi:homoserine O-succinyltransferase/O-acetyltransferase
MPLLLNDRRRPMHWINLYDSSSEIASTLVQTASECVRLAFINNMPDSAIEDTETQFFSLIHSASAELPVVIELYSLPGVSRGESAQQHLDRFYLNTEKLLSLKYDGAIITGTEPRHPDLRKEPYWNSLCDVFKWAETHTFSTVLSCLAAHAGVLFSDGISRSPIGIKRFGVFEHEVVQDHPLTKGVQNPLLIPHSRWNELREDSLTAAGYQVLTRSAVAGVDLFVKQKDQSLFVHLQGHPEYMGNTLYKEYRRDVRRFLRTERDTYPEAPFNYFDEETSSKIKNFELAARANPVEQLMTQFPEAEPNETNGSAWQRDSIQIYRNWLAELVAVKNRAARAADLAQAAHT